MIYDALVKASFLVPVPAASFGGSIGFDLNPDFGNGHMPRKAGMPGEGHDFAIRCRVTQAFTVNAGTPIAQVHAVLSTAGNPNTSPPALVSAGDFVVIGSNVGPCQLDGADLLPGFQAADLTINSEFYIKCNPWTEVMGRAISGAVEGPDLRYLGVIINIPNYSAAANSFSAGILQCNVVLASDASQQAVSGSGRRPVHFPSGVLNK